MPIIPFPNVVTRMFEIRKENMRKHELSESLPYETAAQSPQDDLKWLIRQRRTLQADLARLNEQIAVASLLVVQSRKKDT